MANALNQRAVLAHLDTAAKDARYVSKHRVFCIYLISIEKRKRKHFIMLLVSMLVGCFSQVHYSADGNKVTIRELCILFNYVTKFLQKLITRKVLLGLTREHRFYFLINPI